MTVEIHCKHCDRFLGTTDKSTVVTLKCSNTKCKKMETYIFTFASDLGDDHVCNTPEATAVT